MCFNICFCMIPHFQGFCFCLNYLIDCHVSTGGLKELLLLRLTPKFLYINAHQGTQENKLGLLSHLGCGMKTPLSLRERATVTLTGPVMGAATARHFLNSVQS